MMSSSSKSGSEHQDSAFREVEPETLLVQVGEDEKEDPQFVFMKITDFKSPRLLWLLLVVPFLIMVVSFPGENYRDEGIISALRGVISVGGVLGCLFYAIGARVFTRKFWQVYFGILVLDELVGLYENWSGYNDLIAYLLLIWPIFVMVGLYAFHNRTIWWESSSGIERKRWGIPISMASAGVVASAVALFFVVGTDTIEVQPTDADRAAILTIEDLAPRWLGFEPAPSAGQLTKTQDSSDDGIYELNYTYDHAHQGVAVYLHVGIYHQNSPEESQGAYAAYDVGQSLAMGLQGGRQKDELFHWGDESKFTEFSVEEDIGHVLLARKGKCNLFVIYRGIAFGGAEAFSEFLVPHLERMSSGC